MQILKAFFKIASKLKGSLITYLVIFLTIGMFISGSAANQPKTFEQSKLLVVIFDEDETPESKALYDYIAANHDIVEVENDPEKLWDSLYYHTSNYVLTIKKGYSENIKNGSTENLFTYSVDPQSYNCEYLNMQLREYVSTLELYLKSGKEFSEAQADTVKTLSNGTEVTSQNFSEKETDSDENSRLFIFMRFLAYVLPAIMIEILSRIIIELRRDEMKKRTLCSPITPFKYNGQIILGSIIFSVAIWALTVAVSFMFSGTISFTESLLYALVNSFLFVLISTGISVFISMCFEKNSLAIDMIANIVCLGMAFLCGVFVDQSVLGENVLNVGKFLPAYWYVCAIDNISQINGSVFSSSTVMGYFGIELLFAAAFFLLSLVVARFKAAPRS